MTASTVLDFMIAIGTLAVILLVPRKMRFSEAMKYFTVQSNLLCATVSLVCAVWVLFRPEPGWLLVVKYAATCAVAVTFVTVFCYLGPRFRNWDFLLSGANLWMHLICPLIAIASLLLRAPVQFPFAVTFAGLAPVVLYGFLYVKKVILDPPARRWEDLYGFTKGVNWKLRLTAMLALSLAVGAALRLLLKVLG